MKLIKMCSTARFYKGKTAKYAGEVIHQNGRHAVYGVIMTGGKHDSHGGIPIELDVQEVEFLFPESERDISTQ